jgi:transaldolase
MNFGVQPQRLLWASTGTKDPALPLGYYIDNLLAPYTINTMPEKTMLAYAGSGEPGMALAPDGGDANAIILEYEHAGINYFQLAATLQQEGAASFVTSWHELLAAISRTGQQHGKPSAATR